MIKYYAHESMSNHVHTSDSSSPAIYVGAIVIVAVLLAIGVALLLNRNSSGSDPANDETKKD